VECWGSDRNADQSSPPSGTFQSLDSGFYHTCAVKADGTVECWGNDDGNEEDFGQSIAPSGTFQRVSAGAYHTCGVRTDGNLECWGWDYHEQVSKVP